METILHLFITNECRHNCPLCCNRLYVIDEIPVVTVELLKKADTVCLTGGEPLSIHYDTLYRFVAELRSQYTNIKSLYIYTSGAELLWEASIVERMIMEEILNGINVAPKDGDDWDGFLYAIKKHPHIFSNGFSVKPSNRLYVFDEQRKLYDKLDLDFEVINLQVLGRKWDKVFNTPENEHFVRLPILF